MKMLKIFFMVVLFAIFAATAVFAATEAKITASDAQGDDNFGKTVAIDGDYAIVGAHLEDDGGSNAGAAYIYHRTDTNTWDAGVKIVAPDAEADDRFGTSVAIDGKYAVVGANNEDAGGADAGAAYVFYRTGTNTWDTGTKLQSSDIAAGDQFGLSVGISGLYAIVGANFEGEGGDGAGAAYIFLRTGSNTWDTGTKVVASDPQAYDYFGDSVDISGDYAIVGASQEDGSGLDRGAAYIFQRTGENTWSAATKIVASDPQNSDYFGAAVNISGDYAVVGAYMEDGSGTSWGAAYVFFRTSGNTWDAGTKIVASDPQNDDYFGAAVGISGPYIVVGAFGEDPGGLSGAGSAYLFSRTGETTWSAGTKITASDQANNDYFGYSAAIYGEYAIVGAIFEDPGSVSGAGSAYIINHDLPTAIDLLAFEAAWTDTGAALSWKTGSETECGAFTLLRCELGDLWNGDQPVCLSEEYQELDIVVPCVDSLYGADYEVEDLTADPAANYAYMLREYETTGGINEYGPVILSALKNGDELPDEDDPADDDDDPPSGDDSADADDDDAGEASSGAEDSAEDEGGCGF